MKCETCGNAMVWVGSLASGKLECEHCTNDDGYMEAQLGKAVVVCSGGSGGSANAQSAGNPLVCGNACSMNGGQNYCDCYGEPSILKEQAAIAPRPKCSHCGWSLGTCSCNSPSIKDPLIDNKLNPYAKCSHCGNSISNCSCRIQQLTYQYLREIKGEFKC